MHLGMLLEKNFIRAKKQHGVKQATQTQGNIIPRRKQRHSRVQSPFNSTQLHINNACKNQHIIQMEDKQEKLVCQWLLSVTRYGARTCKDTAPVLMACLVSCACTRRSRGSIPVCCALPLHSHLLL